ncbi:helix-turn-helix domain-containing protein [Clostridium coskatii]|uniref:HTH-type transcriptional regulator ImmR n=1 Tax=Clostridium coskatii TaxID=1705578 RepID=A0A166T175_9CLOT|nr:helix-turn-helix transcriptional regulator [Clostridium coskatii]OAA93047.1 HTH-type transcriptional regulator ImmR [Clostridium coskatii]OBR90790.1 HTH-type transcriptional regulator ImmR [Clostridium coskatii]
MEINEKIKNRREELGLTLQEVGEYLGVSKATVQRYESGEIKNLKLGTIEKLAQILKISPSYLMGWNDPEENKVSKITDIKEAIKVIMTQPGLMLNGEALSDESKIALANAIQLGIQYAEQMQKKEKENN